MDHKAVILGAAMTRYRDWVRAAEAMGADEPDVEVTARLMAGSAHPAEDEAKGTRALGPEEEQSPGSQ